MELKQWHKIALMILICAISFCADWSCIAVLVIVAFGTNRGDFKKQMGWMLSLIHISANRAGARAEKLGFSQVLWLDGVERKYIEEVGSMNVMFKIAGTVVTPKLTGSVLPGITRKSCIALLKEWGVPVEERLLSVDCLLYTSAFGVCPGMLILWASERALARRKSLGTIPEYYVDFEKWLPIMENPAKYFATPAVNLVWAMKEATAIISEEGLKARDARPVSYTHLWDPGRRAGRLQRG